MTEQSPDILWHYTTYKSLRSIMQDGVIKPAIIFKGHQMREKPGVWFSSNQFYEETARRGIKDIKKATSTRDATFGEMIGKEGAVVRIGVEPETVRHTWEDFKRISGIPGGLAKALEQVAIDKGAHPEDWAVSFEPVPTEKFVALEVLIWTDLVEHMEQLQKG